MSSETRDRTLEPGECVLMDVSGVVDFKQMRLRTDVGMYSPFEAIET